MGDAAADIEEGGLTRTLKDLFAGAAGGIAQVLLGEFHLSSWEFLLMSLISPFNGFHPFWILMSRAERSGGLRLNFDFYEKKVIQVEHT